MMLLDTNAFIWLAHGHRRARPLAQGRLRLHVSPATLLEVQLLIEGGRIRLTRWSCQKLGLRPRGSAAESGYTVMGPPTRILFSL